MLFKGKINIDILEFLKFGKFDYIKLGQTKSWILNNFPDPDDFNHTYFLSGKCSIWRYGNIEFHFDNDKLYLIYSDYLNDLDGGKYIQLNKWILEDSTKLTLLEVLRKLNEEDIDYHKYRESNLITLKLDSGVVLSFENLQPTDPQFKNLQTDKEVNPNDTQMVSFAFK